MARNKYAALGRRLTDSGLERVRLTYEEMDSLCGLPETAYRDRPFWANTWVSARAHVWLQAGYVVENVNLGHYVDFVHAPERAKNPGAGRKNRSARKPGKAVKASVRREAASMVPRPCVEEVEKYLGEWNKLEGYPEQEAALDDLFFHYCPKNDSLSDVLLKCAALNTFYSTNIYSITPVARHIVELDIDDRLAAGDLTLVDEIQQVTIKEEKKHFYSFATKYCSHHQPDLFPIYDSYVDKILRYFRDIDRFAAFRNEELKDYSTFRKVLAQFREYYGLERYGIKDIDKYLWQLGKKYFPKKYY